MGVNDNYIQGWVAGFLNNPEIEEQRITDEWESGYEDGKAHTEERKKEDVEEGVLRPEFHLLLC
jgi:hypothetical protein